MSNLGYGIAGVILSTAVGLTVDSLYNQPKTDNGIDNEIKNEIKTTTDISAKDYNKIEQAVDKGTITWERALDSLKTKSAVEKAYFQGGQAVRDSIANVAKIAKTIK